ncbi:MAG: sulfite exporter TauE/SafE family protein [Candidatus Nomurabacteria bacterium]|nr:MAG: sulfite exporter TauE/SafE family protein [Candidatus Nomurabacteria bacterium]
MNYWVFFLAGLTTGGLTCLAVQGGLLAGVIANQKERSENGKTSLKSSDARIRGTDIWPVGIFLLAKLIVHTAFGFLLGWLGSVLAIGLNVRIAFQLAAALFMFATAMNLLNVHPIFRFLAFQPPRWLQRFVKKSSKSDTLFAPAVLGVLTVFIPCGVTQAMEVVAVTSGSPIAGALIMFFFVLGTSPIFTLLGVMTAKLSDTMHGWFQKTAAAILIVLSLISFNGILNVYDAPITYEKIIAKFQNTSTPKAVSDEVVLTNGVQRVTINVLGQGYSPRYFAVEKNKPVELILQSNDVYSCAVAFTFRQFGIDTFLRPTDRQSFQFTPTQPGRYTYSCSMGMYTGVMEVI